MLDNNKQISKCLHQMSLINSSIVHRKLISLSEKQPMLDRKSHLCHIALASKLGLPVPACSLLHLKKNLTKKALWVTPPQYSTKSPSPARFVVASFIWPCLLWVNCPEPTHTVVNQCNCNSFASNNAVMSFRHIYILEKKRILNRTVNCFSIDPKKFCFNNCTFKSKSK